VVWRFIEAKEDRMENKESRYFESILDVCKVINSSLDIKEVLVLITENIVKLVNVKACTIFLLDKSRNELDVSASYGLSEAYLTKGPVEADKSIAETLEGKIVLIHDTSSDSRVQYPEEAKREGIASVLSIPITVKGQIIGVLRIYTSEQRIFSDDEYKLISGLADIGGIAIDNARMYDHLKSDHERLISDTHHWFEFGKMP
jgi:transcriptional regulator with GAF, ATPase, and Fis domain